MSLGMNRLAMQKVVLSGSKGKKFVAELNAAMSPEAIANLKPENAEKSAQKKD